MKRLGPIFLAIISLHLANTSFAAESAKIQNPIVLIHGFFGFGDGMSWLTRYFGDIPDLLRRNGATVYIAEVSQANTIEARGEQLYRQLQWWGHDRYNLIGHSHGGLDARYVLETYPEIVASVTTIGSPHHGSRVADYLYDKVSHHRMARLLVLKFGDILGQTIGLMSGSFHALNVHEALRGLTTAGVEEFNRDYGAGISSEYCSEGPPEYLGRKLYSWGSFRESHEYGHDIFSSLFELTSRAFWDDEENDGLVAICSMKFGKWLGANFRGHHLVPIGGVITRISEDQNHRVHTLFVDHVQRLKREGL